MADDPSDSMEPEKEDNDEEPPIMDTDKSDSDSRKNPREEKRMNLQSKIAKLQHQALIKAASLGTSDSDSDHNASRSRNESPCDEFACSECDRKFDTSSELFQHRASAHKPDSEPSIATTDDDDSPDSETTAVDLHDRSIRLKSKHKKKHRNRGSSGAVRSTEQSKKSNVSDFFEKEKNTVPEQLKPTTTASTENLKSCDLEEIDSLSDPPEESTELVIDDCVGDNDEDHNYDTVVDSDEKDGSENDDSKQSQDPNTIGVKSSSEILSGADVPKNPVAPITAEVANKNLVISENKRNEGEQGSNASSGEDNNTESDGDSSAEVIIYRCKKCDRIFPDTEKLKEHVKENHSVVLCRFCTRSCVGSVSLSEHMEIFHKEKSGGKSPARKSPESIRSPSKTDIEKSTLPKTSEKQPPTTEIGSSGVKISQEAKNEDKSSLKQSSDSEPNVEITLTSSSSEIGIVHQSSGKIQDQEVNPCEPRITLMATSTSNDHNSSVIPCPERSHIVSKQPPEISEHSETVVSTLENQKGEKEIPISSAVLKTADIIPAEIVKSTSDQLPEDTTVMIDSTKESEDDNVAASLQKEAPSTGDLCVSAAVPCTAEDEMMDTEEENSTISIAVQKAEVLKANTETMADVPSVEVNSGTEDMDFRQTGNEVGNEGEEIARLQTGDEVVSEKDVLIEAPCLDSVVSSDVGSLTMTQPTPTAIESRPISPEIDKLCQGSEKLYSPTEEEPLLDSKAADKKDDVLISGKDGDVTTGDVCAAENDDVPMKESDDVKIASDNVVPERENVAMNENDDVTITGDVAMSEGANVMSVENYVSAVRKNDVKSVDKIDVTADDVMKRAEIISDQPHDISGAKSDGVTSSKKDVDSIGDDDVSRAVDTVPRTDDGVSSEPNDVMSVDESDVTTPALDDVTPAKEDDVTPVCKDNVTPTKEDGITPSTIENVNPEQKYFTPVDDDDVTTVDREDVTPPAKGDVTPPNNDNVTPSANVDVTSVSEDVPQANKDYVPSAENDVTPAEIDDFTPPAKDEIHQHKAPDPKKSHQCQTCCKYFKTKTALTSHSKTHDRSVQCEYCMMVFNKKQTLDGHIKAWHMGDKPWECAVCVKTFSKRSLLSKHRASQHPELPPLLEPEVPAADDVTEVTSQELETDDQQIAKAIAEFEMSKRTRVKIEQKEPESEAKRQRIDLDDAAVMTASDFQQCNLCPIQLRTSEEMVMHKRMTHFGERPHACAECGDQYVDIISLKNHIDRTHTIHICDVCSEQLRGSDALDLHRQRHDVVTSCKPFKCHLCGQSFPNERVLRYHLSEHKTDDSGFEATLLRVKIPGRKRKRTEADEEENVENTETASKERRTVSGVQSIDIESDKVVPKEEVELEAPTTEPMDVQVSPEQAEIKSEPLLEKSFICTYCSKTFSRNTSLERHLQTHTGKTHICDQCSLKFVTNYDLSIHKRTAHQGETPHSCKQCDQSFTSLQYLRNHVKLAHEVHTCSTCSETFEGKKAFQVHENIHQPFDPAKPHRCDQCFKYFRTTWELTSHSRIHDPVPTFRCMQCPKAFNRKQSLDDHVKIHSEGKIFHCDICNKSFTRKTSLRDHVVRHHPDTVTPSGGELVKRSGELCLAEAEAAAGALAQEPVPMEGLVVLPKNQSSEKEEAEDFQCSICKEKFNRSDMLEAHELVHTHQGPLQCGECGMQFKDREPLREHLLIHKKSGECQAECLQCGIEFSNPQELKRHLLIHRGTKRYLCKTCGKSFVVPYELGRHRRSVHMGMKDYWCRTCKRRFTSQQGLKTHKLFFHGTGLPKKRFKCLVCDKKFFTETRLDNHMQNKHTDKTPYHCTLCDRKFSHKVKLNRHAYQHDPEKRHNCKYCLKYFFQKSHLARHLATVHNLEIYRCPYCTQHMRYFASLAELLCHKQQSHPMELKAEDGKQQYLPFERKKTVYSFQCDLCSKTFTSKTNLTNHKRIHTNDRPFTCEVCGHKSVSKSSLKIHYTIHVGQKRFICSTCGRGFGREWVLKRHVLSKHTDRERAHKCDQCEKSFRLPIELHQHKSRMHSGTRDRIAQCQICLKKFHDLQRLTEHLSTHDKDGEFCCEFCLIPFPRVSLLRTHTKTHQTLGPYECFLCKYHTTSKESLRIHLGQHEQNGVSQCPLCGKTFRLITNLLSHMIMHSGLRQDKLKFFECEPCELTFWRYDSYQEHIDKLHSCKPDQLEQTEQDQQQKQQQTDPPDPTVASAATAEDPNFPIDNLAKENNSLAKTVIPGLVKPSVLSSRTNSLMCGFCGKEFSRKYTLDRHTKCHTNDRKYKCDICGMRYISKYDLTLHMRRHNNEKPFVCSVCGKAYEVAYRLTTHMKNSKDEAHKELWRTDQDRELLIPYGTIE